MLLSAPVSDGTANQVSDHVEQVRVGQQLREPEHQPIPVDAREAVVDVGSSHPSPTVGPSARGVCG